MEFRRSRSASKLSNNHNNPFYKYEIGQMLGQGQYGKVYKATLKNQKISKFIDEIVYAIKIIPIGKLKKNPKLKQLLQNQIQILSRLKNQYVIKFEELFVWEQKVYMVYQYCQGGNLQDMMPLTQRKGIQIFGKIIMACSFAEKNKILHRDIKPANILFKNGQPRVADWGFSRYLKQELTATSFVGSPAYMAPQLLNGSQYTNKADVWSFGVMVYQCLFNQMPWPAKNIKDLLFKLRTTPLTLPKQTSPVFKLILKSCLQINPQKRSSFQNLQSLLFQFKIKKQKTQENQNPQDNLGQLSQQQIRKCSYYLQFAKHSQKFQDQQTKILCLQLILTNLRKMKNKQFFQRSERKQDNFMSPCLSQRKMSLTKRQLRSPNTETKLTKRQTITSCSQTQALLDKEINLIQKIKHSHNSSRSITTSSSRSKLHFPDYHSERLLIKQIIKKLIKNISMSQKSSNQSIINKTTRRQLVEMNCMLEVIMYEQLVEQAKNKRLSQKLKQMEGIGINQLIRTVNHKILYVNQSYCKKSQ